MVEKKLGYSCSVHGFGARGKNYPLTKAMVNHDHDRVKTVGQGKIGDEVDGEVLEGARAFKGEGSDGWDHRMGEDLVCLANYTTGNVFPDIGEKARPPVILGEKGNGVKMATVTAFKRTVGSGDQIVASWLGNIETEFIIEASIIEGPILSSSSVEEGKFFLHLMDGLKD